MKTMRHIFPAVLAAILLLLPPLVLADSETGKNLLRGLLQVGIEAVGQQDNESVSEQQVAPAQKKTASAPINNAVTSLSQSLKKAVEQTLDSVKERYMEEGRVYARELSDVIVERLMQNPRIRSVTSTIQLVCIALVAYLVLITIVLLMCISRVQKSNREILRLLKKRGKDISSINSSEK